MKQSKLGSLLESVGDVAVGFIIALAIWQFIVMPIFDLATSFIDNLAITGIFTVSGLIRKYVIRRIFNDYQDSGLSVMDYIKSKLTFLQYI